MTTTVYGTEAGNKFQDGGWSLSGCVYRSDGTSDDVLMDFTDLGVDGDTVLYLRPGSKQNALDQTANNNDGTVSGATLGENGYDFNGGTNKITIADSPSLDGMTTDYQVEAWIWADTYGGSSYGRIADRDAARWVWYLYAGTGEQISFYAGGDRLSSTSLTVTGGLRHLAAGRAATEQIKHFLNGNGVGTPTGANLSTGSQALTVGNNAAANRGFDGRIDELKISKVQRYGGNFTPTRFPASATASVVIDGTSSQDWTNVAWTATTTGDYEGSVSQLRYRAGATNPPTGDWTTIGSPTGDDDIDVTGRYLQIEFTLTPKADTNRTETPRLTSVTLTHEAAAGGGVPPWLGALRGAAMIGSAA